MPITVPKGHVSGAVPTCINFQSLLVAASQSKRKLYGYVLKEALGPGLLEEGPAVDTIHLNNHTGATLWHASCLSIKPHV